MREYLFRGIWRVDNQENRRWVYGGLMQDQEGDYAIGTLDLASDIPTHYCFVENATVGQYTGLKDCKGTKIFEGDIVRAFSNINKISDPHLTNREPEYENMMVIYRESGFCLRTKEGAAYRLSE